LSLDHSLVTALSITGRERRTTPAQIKSTRQGTKGLTGLRTQRLAVDP
jgi:hypothetical protein